jgi:hypothetical protein
MYDVSCHLQVYTLATQVPDARGKLEVSRVFRGSSVGAGRVSHARGGPSRGSEGVGYQASDPDVGGTRLSVRSSVKKLRRSSLSGDAYATVKELLLEGERYRPGGKISVEELSRELGVSRTPIWGAINRLEAEGVVETPTGLWESTWFARHSKEWPPAARPEALPRNTSS